jgi:peptidoglycan biosynthesis protein MviN/MurJ (putative lipid II flippase)
MEFNFTTNKEDWGCGTWLLVVVLILAIAFALLCLEAWFVMLLWNAVIPLIWATAPTLGFWAAMGLLLLCHILFGKTVKVKSKD